MNEADHLARHLAIIPARGGSRRIPRKNIKLFAGKPMIAYALQAAQASGLFRHILVSTDDAEIAAVAQQYGAQVPFMRPADLADDHSGVMPVVQQAINACRDIGWEFEKVCCIFPCVPLLKSADLLKALEIMQQADADYAFAVSEFPSRIQRALRREANGAMQAFFPEHTATRTQDLEAAYFDVGQFYWGKQQAWLAGTSPLHGGQACMIEPWRAVDIDTPADWQRAEQLFAVLRQG